MQVFKETASRQEISVLKEIPIWIKYVHGFPATLYFSDENYCSVGCIGCINPRCMQFEAYEISCEELADFPNDKNLNVCPVDAISWDTASDTPIVNEDKCIICGICIRRCPVGAFYFDKIVKVNRSTSSKMIKGVADNAFITLQAEQIDELSNITRDGTPIIESDELFNSIYNKLIGIKSNYHNIIGRNLLISLGCRCAMRRIGDVYTRMDAVYSSRDKCFGTIEIEFGRDTLDASRGILDDIAILYTRYGIKKNVNIPLVICLQFPNARQGYWQVVKDIKAIEDINISTITIGAMMLLNWNGCFLLPDDGTYYMDYDNMDLRPTILWQIGRKIQVSDKYLGILEPQK